MGSTLAKRIFFGNTPAQGSHPKKMLADTLKTHLCPQKLIISPDFANFLKLNRCR
jgi:hypothetical protein